MANIVKNYDSSKIIQGPADVYLDVKAPPSAIPGVQGTNCWGPAAGGGLYTVDTAGQPADNGSAGVHLGLMEGPATITVTPKFAEILGDQFAAPVDAAFVSADFEVDFVAKEALLQTMQKYFSSTLGTYTSVVAGANPAADFLQFGNENTCAITFHTIMFVSPDRSNVGKFYIVQAYKCFLASAVQTTFARVTQTTWKLKFKCIADTSRVMKDCVAQIVKIKS
jgi:hypothetical protein